MDQVLDIIKEKSLIKKGEVIGVAVSGGVDSMTLLHFLNSVKEKLDVEIVAITIDHCIRENSSHDCQFVIDWCRSNRIRCHKFTVDAVKLSQSKSIGIEQAAREVRYGMFDALIKKGIVDKIALAHHLSDQAETILLNIFRGAGIGGASGMEYIRDKVYIRPFLNISKDEIERYAAINEIGHIEDETNNDPSYTRNLVRLKVMPPLRKKFPTIDQNIVNFGNACKEDNDFIASQASFDAIIKDGTTVRIPLNYFVYNTSITSRMIMYALNILNGAVDIERKHINAIRGLATAENGKKIDLPNHTHAIKEYEYITVTYKEKKVVTTSYKMTSGDIDFSGLYNISIKKTKTIPLNKDGVLVMDSKKVPGLAVWRTRGKGDFFEKFGGGTKPLREYLIDKKVPARLRDTLPVLAIGQEILCILGVEISEKVKTDKNTNMVYVVTGKPIK